MAITNPYESPEEMATFLRKAIGKQNKEKLILYLEGSEKAHREANDPKMADFWKRVREIIRD